MTDKTQLLPVTQSDRDAAAALVAWHNKAASEWKTDGGSNLQFFTSDMPDQIRRCAWDNHDVVQAFARHRMSHSLPGDVGMRNDAKPAAWMYERGAPFPVRYIHDVRMPAYLANADGWTETPLYAALTPTTGNAE